MTLRSAGFFLLLLLALTALALASDNDYVIGPGDVLDITVYGEPDLARTVTVQNDNSISFPLIHTIKLGGRTVQQAEDDLEKALGQYLVQPQVSILIKEHRAQMVFVLGAVNKPGAYPLTGRTTVLEMISIAGGIAPEGSKKILLLRGASNPAALQQVLEGAGGAADEQRLQQAAHAQTPPIVIDGQRLLDEGDTSQNMELHGGDVLYVPKAKLVYVLGEVRRPGGVPYTDGLTVIQAISLAGGTTEMAADAIEVTRRVEGQEKHFKLDYAQILRNGALDLRLEPNDVIVVKRRLF